LLVVNKLILLVEKKLTTFLINQF